MDKEAAATMMEAIPPFDWSEVVLKKDLDAGFLLMREETKAAISQAMNQQTKTFVGWMFAGNSVLVAAFAAIVIFAK